MQRPAEYGRIESLFTHDDFDGLGSAALFCFHFDPVSIEFTSPKRIPYDPVTERDGVTDLPFPRRCAIWFDHHEQNFDDPAYQGIDPAAVAGLRMPAPSCARVILTWYENHGITVPEHFYPLVAEIDKYDQMNFGSIEEWLSETPARIVNESLFLPTEKPRDRNRHYFHIISLLEQYPLEVAAADPQVEERYQIRQKMNGDGRDILLRVSRFHPRDRENRLLIIDFTSLRYPPYSDKRLALIDFPGIDYLLTIYPHIENQVKTNSVTISIGRNFLRRNAHEPVDWGAFFAQKDIGGGHRDAAGARLDAGSKAERDRLLEQLVTEMLCLIQNSSPRVSVSS